MNVTVILAALGLVALALVVVALSVLASTHRDTSGYQPPASPPFPETLTARRSMIRESYDPSGRPTRETDEREIAYQGPSAALVAGRALALPEPQN